MAIDEHEAILKEGVDAWNSWREQNPHVTPDLRGSVLLQVRSVPDRADTVGVSGMQLDGIDLSRVDLRGACLWRASLRQANLREAQLDGANLSDADLSEASLLQASLRGANLQRTQGQGAKMTRADLSDADLREADFTGAELSQATLNRAVLAEVILRRAKLLDVRGSLADFSRAKLDGANFFHSTLEQCNFAGAEMPGVRFAHANCFRSNFSYVKASGADLDNCNLVGVSFLEADLTDAQLDWSHLEAALLIRTDLRGANLSHASTYGASVWEIVTDERTIQYALPITSAEAEGEPWAYVDDIETAQFLHMLRDHKKLGRIIDALTSRLVLLLGGFRDGGLERLQAVATALRSGGLQAEEYWPVIFDFDRPKDRNLEEGAKILVGLAKFVIADLGGPSVPHELAAYVRTFRVPFVPIIKHGSTPYALFESLEDESNVLPIVQYVDLEDLLRKLPQSIIKPAEAKYRERRERLEKRQDLA